MTKFSRYVFNQEYTITKHFLTKVQHGEEKIHNTYVVFHRLHKEIKKNLILHVSYQIKGISYIFFSDI